MKKLRKISSETPARSEQSESTPAPTTAPQDKAAENTKQQKNKSGAYTPKKGKPTPKRNDVEREHGVRHAAYTAPLTGAELRKQRKELKASMTKEEFKAYKRKERERANAARRKANDRMMAGDENYLLERDKGPVKRFVRNWVDSNRYAMNFFLPLALLSVLVMTIGARYPLLANTTSLVMMIFFLLLILEGIWLGRRVNNEVEKRFPDNPHGRFTLGFYAFTRATMIRRLRTPSPQKNIGDSV